VFRGRTKLALDTVPLVLMLDSVQLSCVSDHSHSTPNASKLQDIYCSRVSESLDRVTSECCAIYSDSSATLRWGTMGGMGSFKVILSLKRGYLSFNKGAAVLDAPITIALLTHAPMFLVAPSRRLYTRTPCLVELVFDWRQRIR
jgi:hypothetical protein